MVTDAIKITNQICLSFDISLTPSQSGVLFILEDAEGGTLGPLGIKNAGMVHAVEIIDTTINYT